MSVRSHRLHLACSWLLTSGLAWWQRSQMRVWWQWYRAVWLAEPMRQTGLIVLVALLVYRVGHGVLGVTRCWWLEAALAAFGLVALMNTQSWVMLWQDSHVGRWWDRQRLSTRATR